MPGDNMESLLLDSSSGESDTEQSAPRGAGPPAAAPAAPPATTAASMSQSEMAQRLKSMYSPANKAGGGGGGATPAAAPPPPAAPRPSQPSVLAAPPGGYRTSTSGGSSGVTQQQLRGGVPHQQQQMPPRANSLPHPPQEIQRRPGGGMPPQQMQRSGSVPHPTQQQQRPIMAQRQPPMQQPQHPSVGVPHQQPPLSVRRNSHGQQAMTAPSSRAAAPAASAQAPRAGGYGSVAQTQPSADRAAMERDLKKQKERFLVFTRVLMKYLEQKDPPLHLKVKAIIKECAERNRKKEPGYESVTASMRVQLKKVVNEGYWKRAEAYLDHFLNEKAKSGSQSALLLSYPGTGSGSTAATGSTSGAASHDDFKRKQADQERQQKMHQHMQESSRNSQQEQVQSNLSSIRDEMAKQRQNLSSPPSSSRSNNTSKPVSAFHPNKGKNAPKSRAKGASTPTGLQQRKTSLTIVGGADGASAISAGPAAVAVPPMVREYSELMEHVDHAANFDWTVAGSVFGDATQWMITDEQKKLVYDSKTTVIAAALAPKRDASSFPLEGWSERNVISCRIAWSRLRLRGRKRLAPDSNQLVGGGLLGMPLAPNQWPITTGVTVSPAATDVNTEWYNEEKAEEDAALAVLSEGAEMYLKTVLEKALHCARQRQNLDGIRLWHQQFAENSPLSLRLGCDVDRQFALVAGNAAMTCKRMEEALERQTDVPIRDRVLNEETLAKANSMSDIAIRPKLGEAARKAEVEGMRNFEVYGGKDSVEPPFGRVPKSARLEVVDFQKGMQFARPGRRHRAATISASFFY